MYHNMCIIQSWALGSSQLRGARADETPPADGRLDSERLRGRWSGESKRGSGGRGLESGSCSRWCTGKGMGQSRSPWGKLLNVTTPFSTTPFQVVRDAPNLVGGEPLVLEFTFPSHAARRDGLSLVEMGFQTTKLLSLDVWTAKQFGRSDRRTHSQQFSEL